MVGAILLICMEDLFLINLLMSYFSALQMSSEALTVIYGSKLAGPFDTAIWDQNKTQYIAIIS
jgi:hypothetical protein